jgi:hypothetical protein
MTQVCIHEPKTYTLSDSDAIPSFSIKRNLAFQDAPRLIKTTEHAISNYIWNKDYGAVTWQLESDSPDFGNRKDQIKLFKRVFFQASIETPLIINQKRRGTAEADIVITFQGSKDNPFFKKRKSALAYAYGASSGIGGDITFNDDYIWTLDGKPITALEAYEKGLIKGFDDPTNKIKTFDAQHTGTHEGGHALSMDHLSDCNGCVMFDFYNGKRKFHVNDLAYLHRLYGKSGVSHRIKTHLYRRFGIL